MDRSDHSAYGPPCDSSAGSVLGTLEAERCSEPEFPEPTTGSPPIASSSALISVSSPSNRLTRGLEACLLGGFQPARRAPTHAASMSSRKGRQTKTAISVVIWKMPSAALTAAVCARAASKTSSQVPEDRSKASSSGARWLSTCAIHRSPRGSRGCLGSRRTRRPKGQRELSERSPESKGFFMSAPSMSRPRIAPTRCARAAEALRAVEPLTVRRRGRIIWEGVGGTEEAGGWDRTSGSRP
jgi:hypothetical protein